MGKWIGEVRMEGKFGERIWKIRRESGAGEYMKECGEKVYREEYGGGEEKRAGGMFLCSFCCCAVEHTATFQDGGSTFAKNLLRHAPHGSDIRFGLSPSPLVDIRKTSQECGLSYASSSIFFNVFSYKFRVIFVYGCSSPSTFSLIRSAFR